MSKKQIISYSIDVILVLIIGVLLYAQISMIVTRNKNYGVPSAFGKSFLYVATDSMDDGTDDCLSPGTGIIIEKVGDYSSLKASTPIYDEEGNVIDYQKDGDIVTFYLESIKYPDTHRLIDINYDEASNYYTFRTMGDNPEAHSKFTYEEWGQQFLIGKVTFHSHALGDFLAIASPSAAASAGKTAWFFPVAMIIPISGLAIYYIIDAIRKYQKENKEREAKILAAMEASGIDMNDDEAVELFRMKEEIRMDYQEEYQKTKEKMKREIEKQRKKDEKEKNRPH